MAKLVFGCGYLGGRVARRWVKRGECVYAVTRSERRAEELLTLGIQPIVFDITSPSERIEFPTVSTVLFSVGYDRSSGESIRDVYVGGLRRALSALDSNVSKFIYISSTGVYGQIDGDWVDESSPCQPTREGGKACLEAENILGEFKIANRSVILRLAGIYGPERLPRLQDLKADRPLACPAEGWLNLVHVDDAVEAVLEVERLVQPPAVYLVADGHPVSRREFYREVARTLQLPEPQFTDPPADAHASQRASADKRISNRRLVADLQVKLRYPSYREGVRAIAARTITC
jgi:nucleoside-diphosphate-sugar epimerase